MSTFSDQTAHILRACGQLARCLGVAEPIRLLVVDDDSEYPGYLNFMLQRAKGTAYQVEVAHTWEEAEPLIRQNRHDLYIIDLKLGTQSGLDLVRKLQREGRHFPYVILTGASYDDRVAMSRDCMLWMHKQDYTRPEALDQALRYAIKSWLTRQVHSEPVPLLPPTNVPA